MVGTPVSTCQCRLRFRLSALVTCEPTYVCTVLTVITPGTVNLEGNPTSVKYNGHDLGTVLTAATPVSTYVCMYLRISALPVSALMYVSMYQCYYVCKLHTPQEP